MNRRIPADRLLRKCCTVFGISVEDEGSWTMDSSPRQIGWVLTFTIFRTERVTNLGLLQRKIRLVEEENVALKLEVNHIKTLTQSLEEKEQQLVTDFSKKLGK